MRCEDDRKKKFSWNALSKVPRHGRWHVLNFEDGMDGLLQILFFQQNGSSLTLVSLALHKTKEFIPVRKPCIFKF